jgi:twitching motility protein PilT
VDFNELLRFAAANNASDVHIQSAVIPMLRIAGQMRPTTAAAVSAAEVREFIRGIAPEDARERLDAAIVEGLDFSHAVPGLVRFRCSAYSHLGAPAITMRLIKAEIPTIEQLNLPKVVHDIALSRRGLILLTGTTGSGKSTTLAAMIDLVNRTHATKVITIEDPIEYVHESKKALISQLEVGTDTPSFDRALRGALRQDPDIVLVGELRDVETLRMALRAADTGHQVFSTVHSSNAPQTIERIIAMFPPAEHKLLLAQLSSSLEAVISQRLLRTDDGGRRPAVEIMRGTAVTEKYILENRVEELEAYIRRNEAGMQTFDQHLLSMFNEGLITGTEALRWATTPESLAMAMRGISAEGAGGEHG